LELEPESVASGEEAGTRVKSFTPALNRTSAITTKISGGGMPLKRTLRYNRPLDFDGYAAIYLRRLKA